MFLYKFVCFPLSLLWRTSLFLMDECKDDASKKCSAFWTCRDLTGRFCEDACPLRKVCYK